MTKQVIQEQAIPTATGGLIFEDRADFAEPEGIARVCALFAIIFSILLFFDAPWQGRFSRALQNKNKFHCLQVAVPTISLFKVMLGAL